MIKNMIAKPLIVLMFALTLLRFDLAIADDAASDAKGQTELISYSELMSLSPTNRAAYIEGVQTLLIELAKNQGGHFSDSDPKSRSRLHAMLEWLDHEMKIASADESSTCGADKACRNASATCWAKGFDVKWTGRTYGCDILGKLDKTKTWEETVNARSNPKPLVSMAVDTPADASTALSPVTAPLAPAPTASAPTVETSGALPAEKIAAATASVDVPPLRLKPLSPANIADIEKKLARESLGESDSQKDGKVGTVFAGKATDKVNAKSREASGSKPLTFEVEKAKKKVATAEPLGNLSCAPKPQVCADPKSWRAKAFAGNQKCIFAGMISELDKDNRKCQAVTEFKVGELSFKCATGQTMCNPLLFGSVGATTAICVGRGNDVTLQCSKLSAPRDAERFVNRNATGLQGKWDDFKSAIAAACKPDSPSAKFHCAECNIMEARIFALNARFTKDPCGDLQGIDQVDMKLRLRGSKPSKQTPSKLAPTAN